MEEASKIQNQHQQIKVSNQYMLSLTTNKALRKKAITITGKGGAKVAMIDPPNKLKLKRRLSFLYQKIQKMNCA